MSQPCIWRESNRLSPYPWDDLFHSHVVRLAAALLENCSFVNLVAEQQFTASIRVTENLRVAAGYTWYPSACALLSINIPRIRHRRRRM
jgi:hypothetical protein